MPLQIVTVPCLQDNYAYLAHDPATGLTCVVDVPEAAPLLEALASRGWRADLVLLTHHHWDHVDGLADLCAHHTPRIAGAAADAHRLPALDIALREGDHFTIGTAVGDVIDVSGHTLGHIAVHFPESSVVFTADSLMAMGCGRLFEGTPAQMFDSLGKLTNLPPETLVCSGHEYTESNLRFALTIEPQSPALRARAAEVARLRAEGRPTVPSTLAQEQATNPFLRAYIPEVKAAVGLSEAEDSEVFAALRAAKDRF